MMAFFSQAENLYTPEQYEATLLFVLDKCEVDVAALNQIHALIQATLEDRRLSLKLSRMTVIQGRPRLRDLVSSELKTEERKAQVDTLLETWESYTGFCYKHQFPPTLSERVKSRLYFLASQSRWEWQKYVVMVLPAGGPMLDKVVAHPITQPDLPVILRVLEGLSMDGSAPFPQMTDFRKECFQSFPVTHVQRMTLSQVRIFECGFHTRLCDRPHTNLCSVAFLGLVPNSVCESPCSPRDTEGDESCYIVCMPACSS